MNINTLWDRYKALDDRKPYLTPVLLTLFFTLLMIDDLRTLPQVDSGFVQEDEFGIFLAMLQVLPLIFLRKAPLAVLVVIFAAFTYHSTFDYVTLWIAQFSTLISVYYIASTTDDRQSIIAGLLTIPTIVFVFGVTQGRFDNAFALILLFGGVWVTGNVIRARRNRLEIAELTVVELSDDQERATRDAISDERARIARELHDVLGHTLNLVVIQAGAAQRVFDASPDKALEAMRSIESTSRQALSDVDRMLGILRDPDDGSKPSLEARPSMSRLNALISDLRATGQSIELVVSGVSTTLSPSTDLTAYRVTQEALTNVMTHASGSKAKVEIEYADHHLSVAVINDGSGTDTMIGRKSGGRGIVGMRERTALFGGNFDASATEDGGWCVSATFPISRTNSVVPRGDSE